MGLQMRGNQELRKKQEVIFYIYGVCVSLEFQRNRRQGRIKSLIILLEEMVERKWGRELYKCGIVIRSDVGLIMKGKGREDWVEVCSLLCNSMKVF